MTKRGDGTEKVLGPLEAEMMQIIWATEKPVSVRDLLESINAQHAKPLAYTTVMTVMSRLVKKGALRRWREGRAYMYEALVSDAAGIAVKNVMSEFGEAAIAHFVDEAHADPKVLRRLERLLSEES